MTHLFTLTQINNRYWYASFSYSMRPYAIRSSN